MCFNNTQECIRTVLACLSLELLYLWMLELHKKTYTVSQNKMLGVIKEEKYGNEIV